MKPEKLYLEDDGQIPNNKLPVLIYKNVFEERREDGAAWLENRFAEHNWINAWRNGVYGYHHYHSTSHEVLGVYSGSATLQLGGESGQAIEVAAGDILILPAGTGHKNVESTPDFKVVGAYPDGRSYDLKTGEEGERPQADRNIEKVPLPKTDPLQGKRKGLPEIWEQD